MLRLHSEYLEFPVILLLFETSVHSCVLYRESAKITIFSVTPPTSLLSIATAVLIGHARRDLPPQLLPTEAQRHPVVRATLL